MAMTAEIDKLIEDINSADRSGDWQTRLAASHQAALGSLNATDASVTGNVLNEILRQRVDETVLDDVMAAMDEPDSEKFAAKLGESSANWAATLRARSEQEARTRPRDLSPEFAGINQAQLNTMQQALAEGDMITMLSTMLIMLRQLSQGGQPTLGGAFGGAAATNPAAPVAGNSEPAANTTLSGPTVDMSAKPEGQMLQGYFMQAIFDGNQQQEYRAASPETLEGAGITEGMVAGMAPEDMREMFLAKIERDIENGTFPGGNFPPEQAAQKAQEITAVLFDYALDHGQSIRRSSKDFNDQTSLTFSIDENKMKTAVNMLFSGDAPIMSNTVDQGYSAEFFAEEYLYLREDENYGAGLNVDVLNAHFDKLMNGYDAPNGQHIGPVIDIPPAMQDRFLREVEKAHTLASEDGSFSEEVFGAAMHESFGQIDYAGVSAPMRSDMLDHGVAVHAKIGEANENGDIQVNAPDGTLLFALTNPAGGYAVYSADGNAESFAFSEMDVINEAADIERLFGSEFTIRVAHIPDYDLDGTNSQFAGYFVESGSNSFYIGVDALPEAQVTDAFKAARAENMDTQSREPAPSVVNAMGGPAR